MTLAIASLFLNLSFSQIPQEALALTNSLPGLWLNGETEKAIESSLELFRLSPPFYTERIHNTLALQLANDAKRYGQEYLEQLFRRKDEAINLIIMPMLLWSKAMEARNENELDKIVKDLNILLADSTNYNSRTGRYYLLTLKELDKKGAIDAKSREQVLQKITGNLKAFSSTIEAETGRSAMEQRAWHRYLLAYSYYSLYTTNPDNEEYLKNASDYSPDLNDMQNRQGYFYDALLITGDTDEIGYRHLYKEYLSESNRDTEALKIMCEITFGDPSENNLKSLQTLHRKSGIAEPFSNYWTNYINKMGKPVPLVRFEFDTSELNLAKRTDSWIYMDIWGTWCAPCREELPELQLFYVENKTDNNSNLEIFTLSFGSQNLKEFMTDNKYTFPVAEIDKKTSDLFEVTGYPTKILITPDGYYVKIPFGTDWKMYIRNYALLPD
jgi:thiol-disulfide isomerase/thioredoxin